nr:uncharacterized protein LOC101259177 [Solanum lycopersicum]
MPMREIECRYGGRHCLPFKLHFKLTSQKRGEIFQKKKGSRSPPLLSSSQQPPPSLFPSLLPASPPLSLRPFLSLSFLLPLPFLFLPATPSPLCSSLLLRRRSSSARTPPLLPFLVDNSCEESNISRTASLHHWQQLQLATISRQESATPASNSSSDAGENQQQQLPATPDSSHPAAGSGEQQQQLRRCSDSPTYSADNIINPKTISVAPIPVSVMRRLWPVAWKS